MTEQIKKQIHDLIHSHPVVLFMKGTKEQPQCGFSKKVVQALKLFTDDITTVDVLKNPEIREAIKIYSSWPTLPQLYINQEFIGGCDIVLSLLGTGELAKLLNVAKATSKPSINFTNSAVEAFKNVRSADSDDVIRVSIEADFEHGLSFDKKNPDDFIYDLNGVTIALDPYSALRAENLTINYITENLDAGFSFTNPNEPPKVKELSPEELKIWHSQERPFILIDVRPKSEWDKAHISFARPLHDFSEEELSKLSPSDNIVFHCHHGGRSKRMAETFCKKGFKNVFNLTGGVDAWAKNIDPSVPVY